MSEFGGARITAAVAAILFLTSSAMASRLTPPQPMAWQPNGPMNAIVKSDTTTYIGGDFTYVGQENGSWGGIDPSTGLALPGPKLQPGPSAFLPDGSGGWYLGGSDTMTVDGTPVGALVHLLADGTPAPDWNIPVTGAIRDMVIYDGYLYIAGGFSSIGGQVRNNLAAIKLDDRTVTNWNPVSSDEVYRIIASADAVFVCGNFTMIGSSNIRKIAKINRLNGQVDPSWVPNPTGEYESITSMELADNELFVCGSFYNIGGASRPHVAALNINTGLATAWIASGTHYNNDVAVTDNAVYVVSYYANSKKFDRASGAQLAWSAPSLGHSYSPSIDDVTISGTSVILSGQFSTCAGRPSHNIIAVSAEGELLPVSLNAPGNVTSTLVHNGVVYVSGSFEGFGGLQRNGLVALDTATGTPTSFNPDMSSPNGVASAQDMILSDSTLYVCGMFNTVGGEVRNNAAAFDMAGNLLPWDPNCTSAESNQYIRDMLLSDSDIILGGLFSSVHGQARTCLASVSKSGDGTPTEWAPIFDAAVASLASGGPDLLVVGGEFSIANGQSSQYLAAINRTTGELVPWTLAPDGPVYRMYTHEGRLYMCGAFSNINSSPRGSVAAIDQMTGTLLPWNPAVNMQVRDMARIGKTMYLVGYNWEGLQGISGFDLENGAPTGATCDFDRANIARIEQIGSKVFLATPDPGFGGSTLFNSNVLYDVGFALDSTPGATLTGESAQIVPYGAMTSPVNVVVPEGEEFWRWMDGSNELGRDASLVVNGVTDDHHVVAQFKNAAVSHTFSSDGESYMFQMDDGVEVTLTVHCSVPGSITVKRMKTLNMPPAFFRNPQHILKEKLIITSTGFDSSLSVDLEWQPGTSNIPESKIDKLWRFTDENGIPAATYDLATVFEGVIRVNGIQGFSTWFAGSRFGVPVELSSFSAD